VRSTLPPPSGRPASGAAWRLRLWADGREVAGQYILAVANNIRRYMGGHSELSPNAFLDDGLLDLCCSAATAWQTPSATPTTCGAATM